MMRSLRLPAAALLMTVAVSAAACGGKKQVQTPASAPAPAPAPTPTTPAPPPPPAPPPAPTPTPAPTDEELFSKMTLDQLNQKGVLGDVFFAYDSVELGQDARGTLQKNSDYLKRWGTTKVVVEGHADARGTNEYNLALGERRAAATRDYVVSLGIATERINVVSKGEEQPVCREENEACWQKNRRGHFIFTAK
ncbi:MAG TPA: OmpA family protein [Vicinamibacterales bacterium]|jgi:peptidoglycan-associated lipoprotein|nr:OmpA family protein [Vicinamibacterales bacterium]